MSDPLPSPDNHQGDHQRPVEMAASDFTSGVERTSRQASTPSSRLHWTSLFFDIVSHSRNYLIPAVIALFSAAKGNDWGVIIASVFFIPSLAASLFRYFTLKFRIDDGKLVVEQGLIFTSVRTIPVARIQNIDLVQNVMHRLMQVAEVRIETASGREPEAVLRVLTLDQVECLRYEIFGAKSPDENLSSTVHDHTLLVQPESSEALISGPVGHLQKNLRDRLQQPTTVLVEIKLSWLILAGLASNRGMIMFGIAIGLLYQFDAWERIDFNFFQNLAPVNLGRPALIGLGILVLIVALLLLRVLGIGWYMLRFFGYRLVQSGDDLQISCGLLTKVSATVPRRRIQLISIHQSLILKWLGLTTLRIETAGGNQDQEDASQSVSRRWFLPVLPETELKRILDVLRPGCTWDFDVTQWATVAPRAFSRSLRKLTVISLVVGGVGWYFLSTWGGLIGVVVFLLMAGVTYLDLKSTRYARLSDGIVFKSGFFQRKTSYTFFDNLQTLVLKQSVFDRRWNMASLTIDTAGAGPSEHPVIVAGFQQEFVFDEFRNLNRIASQHLPDFAKRTKPGDKRRAQVPNLGSQS